MSDLSNLLSTLLHLAIDKLGLSSTTRAIILPHIPNIIIMVKNITSDGLPNLPNISIITEVCSHLTIPFILIILSTIGYYWKKHYKPTVIKTTEVVACKDFKKEEPEKIKIMITNYSDVMGILFYIQKNADNKLLIKTIRTNNLKICNNFMINQTDINKPLAFNCTDLKVNFGKSSITFPDNIALTMKVDPIKFGTDWINIEIQTEQTKTTKDNKDNDSDKKELNKTTKLELYMSMTIIGLDMTNANGYMFINYFMNNVKSFLDEMCVQETHKKIILKKEEISSINNYSKLEFNFFTTDHNTFEERYISYIDTFIHQEAIIIKEMVLSLNNYIINPTNINPLSPCIPHISLLLYGPPGSGKSSLGIRLAKVFNRSIKYINITLYTRLSDLITIMISHRNLYSVVILDEFDKHIEKLNDDIKIKTSSDGNIIASNPKYDYTADDLLRVFDESYMVSGAITIATTNNLDIIENIGKGNSKGAMIRAGRLKKMRIGYFDKESVKKLINYKYKHDIKIKDEWFDKSGELLIQNSNFIDILRFNNNINKLDDMIKKEIKNKNTFEEKYRINNSCE